MIHSINDLTDGQIKYMYSILCMTMNRYIWCTGVDDAKKFSELPNIIGIPLYNCSTYLGIAISLTHAAVDLYNWHIVDESKEFSLDNIDTNHLMTNSVSEAWFYKVMIAIEGQSAKIINTINNIIKKASMSKVYDYQLDDVILALNSITVDLNEATQLVKRMYEHCDPEFFFNNLRIYLSGSKNDNLPNGVTVKSMPDLKLTFAGGSAAQSSLIQVIDAFLGVKHYGERKRFLDDMLQYMPGKHRQYIEYVRKGVDIATYVVEQNNRELMYAHDRCIDELTKFRQAHLGLVMSYINRFIDPTARKHKVDDNASTDSNKSNAHGNKGSGGTIPVVFCKDVIKETQNSKVGFFDVHKKTIIRAAVGTVSVALAVGWSLFNQYG